MSQTYQEAIRYLYSLHRFGIKLGLSNIRNLMGALGNPQDRVPIIHVGGTNGKGSTAAFIASMLKRQGYQVGLFTSPHLQDFRERILINHRCISHSDAARHCGQIRKALAENAADFTPSGTVTYFEFVTAMAYRYFMDEEVDFAIMEVGLGGRLDSTNVALPVLTVLTDIDLDHTATLGDTLEQVAGEKCGIIKRGVPVVSSPQGVDVRRVIEETAARCGSLLALGGREFSWERTGYGLEGQTFSYYEGERVMEDLRISLLGAHQVRNAALALACCRRLEEAGYPVDQAAQREGLKETGWPGRLEIVSAASRVMLDCAHNPAAAQALAGAVGELFPGVRPILVFGAMEDKDLRGMMSVLFPLAGRIILTRPEMKRSADLPHLRKLAEEQGMEVESAQTVPHALEAALAGAGAEDLILVTGSIFTVGEAREWFKLAPR